MISLKFGIDELPAETGDICYYCKEFIYDKKFIPWLQVGDIKESTYFKIQMCETCKTENFGEDVDLGDESE